MGVFMMKTDPKKIFLLFSFIMTIFILQLFAAGAVFAFFNLDFSDRCDHQYWLDFDSDPAWWVYDFDDHEDWFTVQWDEYEDDPASWVYEDDHDHWWTGFWDLDGDDHHWHSLDDDQEDWF